MAKTVDITEKLGLEGKPELVVCGTRVHVDNTAKTMLRALALIGDDPENVEMQAIVDVYELVFSEADRKKLDKLELSLTDFTTLVTEAIGLVMGGGPEGEAPTPATA